MEERAVFPGGCRVAGAKHDTPSQDYASNARRRLISLLPVGLSRNALNLNDTTRGESHVVTLEGGRDRIIIFAKEHISHIFVFAL